MTTFQSFSLIEDLIIRDIDMLYVLAAAFMPSILGLLLAFFSLWLPDEENVLSQTLDDRDEHSSADDVVHQWRRAA